MCLRKMYHFTTEAGYKAIRNSRMIIMSPNGAYGPGVYLSDLSPEMHSKEGISVEIFGGTALERVRYAVEVRLPDWKLTHHSHSRHIWTFEEDVDLECCEHYFLDWPDSAPTPIRYPGTMALRDYDTKYNEGPAPRGIQEMLLHDEPGPKLSATSATIIF